MAKQERRIFDKDVQVWVHRYENLRNMAHWHFENELVVCQEGAAEIMLDEHLFFFHRSCWTESSTLCTRATALFSAGNVSTIFAARLTAASQSHNLAIYFTRPVI